MSKKQKKIKKVSKKRESADNILSKKKKNRVKIFGDIRRPTTGRGLPTEVALSFLFNIILPP